MDKHAFNTVLTRGFVTVIMVLQSSLWTRMLAPEGRGLYAKLQASQNLLVLFLGFGVTSGIVYFSAHQRARPEQLWSLSFLITTFGSLFTAALIFVGHLWPSLDLIFPKGYESLFYALYFLFIFIQTQLQLSMNSFLAAQHHFTDLNRIEILTTSLRLLLVASVYFFPPSHPTLEFLFGIDFFIHTLRTLFFTRYFRKLDIKLRLIPIGWLDAKPILVYSFALYALYVIQFLYQRIDVWIIERWQGLAALGIFSCAAGLAQYLTILPMALNTVLTPHMNRSSQTEAYTSLARFSRINSTILLVPVFIFTFFPNQILVLIFGSAFGIGATSLRILGFAYWFIAAKHIFIFFNATQHRLKINFVIELIGLIIGLILNFWWVPSYGVEGAAYAFLSTGALTAILSFLSIQSFSNAKEKNFFWLTLSDIKILKSAIAPPKV
jgi:O-antigen/teichoic acid export membrane protein